MHDRVRAGRRVHGRQMTGASLQDAPVLLHRMTDQENSKGRMETSFKAQQVRLLFKRARN